MDDYINPREALKAEEEERKKEQEAATKAFPEQPEKDVLLFLIEHAPLKPWQRDVLVDHPRRGVLLRPAGADQDHERRLGLVIGTRTIMTEKALQPWECIDYADHHSGTMATSGGRLNPYKLGIELLRDIEHRWNTGKFGKEYDECDDLESKRKWDKELGLGRQKIFEVRRVHNDITFIDTFLTPEFCRRAQDVHLRLAGADRAVCHRVAGIREDQATAAVQPDQLRQTVDLRRGRQLPQPRRTAAAARTSGSICK